MENFEFEQQKRLDFDRWAKLKILIHFSKNTPHFKVRQIWWASLGLNIGREQNGKNIKFTRPVLILKKVSAESAVIIPLSSQIKQDNFFYNFTLNGRLENGLLMQIRLISSKRLIRKIGRVNEDVFLLLKSKLFRNI